MPTELPVLRAAIGDYPHSAALKDGSVASDRFRLAFDDIPTINRAFAPMAREQRFDVSEIAIATFLQAKAYDKPLVLLPVVMAARFQEAALLTRMDSDLTGPADLAGRRVGVRAYSQTTAVWLRGTLSDAYGVAPQSVRWITLEGSHVAEYVDPPWAERAAADKELMAMLRSGEVDAVIVGNDVPDDPGLCRVFPDVAAAAEAFRHKHRLVPVNHLVTVRRDLAERHPEWIGDLVDLFRRAAAGSPGAADRPFGRAALDPGIALALRYCTEQGLLPRPLSLDEVWAGLPPI